MYGEAVRGAGGGARGDGNPEAAGGGGGAYGLVEVLDIPDAGRTGYCPAGGGPTLGGDTTLRGGADPLGGGGGGVGALRW